MHSGQLIKELRLKKGMTQEDLAAKTDISVRTIQRIESGEVDPRAYTLQAIASALEVSFDLFSESDTEDRHSPAEAAGKWLPLLHLSGLLLLIIPPILIWIWKRDQVANIRHHAVDVINYQLSMTLYLLPFAFLSVYPILIVAGLYSQVTIVLNTIKVAAHQPYRYPLSIRFIRFPAAAPES